MSSRRLVVGLLLLLAFLPTVVAEPASLDVTGGLPLRAAGEAVVQTEDAPTLLFQTSVGEVDWSLATPSLRLVEVEYWEEVTQGPFGGHSGIRTVERSFTDARLVLTERLPGFTLVASVEDGTATSAVDGVAPASAEDPAWLAAPDVRFFRLQRPVTVTAPVDQDDVDGALARTIFGRPVPYMFTIEGGSFQVQAPTAEHRLTGVLAGYATNAAVTVRHADGVTDLRILETIEERPGSIYVPDRGWTGPGTHEERIVRYVQFRAADATLLLSTTDAAAGLFASGLDLTLSGHFAIPSASGTILLEDGARVVEAERLVLSGTVLAGIAPGDEGDTAQMSATGDVTYLRLGAEAESFPVGHVAAAAAGLAVLAALGVALWQHGGLLVPLFSRVAKDDVLDHETRSELYEAVKAEPGVSPHDLVRTSGVGWSTVMYHLNVLERAELIVAIRDGRYRRYFDRTSGRFANGRKQVVAALKNETTAAIARHIRDHPGQVQRRLAETFALAASSVHWHVKRLEEAGLVVKERLGATVALVPGPAWEKLEPADMEQVLARAPAPSAAALA